MSSHGFKSVLKIWLVGVWVLMLSRAPADPDLWGHVRFGQDLLATGRLSAVDQYSFTSDRQWINHEWLSEVLMAATFDRVGTAGLNLLRILVVISMLVLVWRRARVIAPAYRYLLVAFAAIGTMLRALPVRPQLFSLVCFAAMLSALVDAEETRRDRLLLCVPPIFALWVNLHGGWIVGLGTMVLWTVACLFDRPRRRWWTLPAATIASTLATLVNPYGVRLWTFIFATVQPSRPMINDWLPIYALPPGFWIGWLIGAGLSIAAWRDPERVRRAYLLPVTILGLAAIRVSRLDAFFCLAAVFLLPSVFPTAAQAATSYTKSRATRVAVLLSAAAMTTFAAFQLRYIDVRRDLMPEPAAVDYVLDHHLNGRFLTWFDWGEFAIWHLGEHGVLVSMDGRRETVYSDSVVNDHLQFYFATSDSVDYAAQLHADYAWLPIGLPAVSRLETKGWSRGFQGPVSVILYAPGHIAEHPLLVSGTWSRNFPGP